MRYILILFCLFGVSGCVLVRKETQEQTQTVEKEKIVNLNDVILEGTISGVPVKLKLKHVGSVEGQKSTDQKTDKNESTSSPALEESGSILGYIISSLMGGGVGAYAIKKLNDGMIQRMSNGIQSYLDEAEDGELLKTHLSRKMDSSDKAKIKNIRNN